MHSLRLTITLGFIALATAACGGGDDGNGDISVADFCAEDTGAFSQFIGKIVECSPEIQFFLGGDADEASIAMACNASFAPFIDDGTVKLGTSEDLDACLAAIMAADCDTLEPDNLPACENIVVGQLELGALCEGNDQCAGETYCAEAGPAGSCGTCTALVVDGQTCVDNNDCASSYCREDSTCGSVGLTGATCETTEDCAGRLVCDSGSVCAVATTKVVGDACVSFEDCGFPVTNLYCNEQMMECVAFIDLGADCNDGQIALGLCNLLAYESCDASGTRKCVAPTIVGMGAQCGFSNGLKCEDGLACEGGEAGRCVATGVGADCKTDSENETCGLFLECKSDGKCDYEDEYTGMCPAS